MRDIFILAIYIPSLLYGLKSPFVALMVFYWISFMNPHRLGWGMTANLPLAMFAALVTAISVVIHNKEIIFPAIKEVFVFLIFWMHLTVTTIFSFYPQDAWAYWFIVFKIFLMTLLTMCIVNTPKRLFLLLVGIIFFLGFYGVKGAIFGVLTGGQYKVWGPPESYIEDNNDLGLAFVMVAPLCFFLKDIFTKKIYSRIMIITGISIMISTILTYSRGALLGLTTMVVFGISRSKHKIKIIVATVLVVVLFLPLLPEKWFSRMDTLKTYEEDESANMRLNSWITSFNLASDNLLGGGFQCFKKEQYQKYSPTLRYGNAGQTAHSIYFQVLIEHGFIGLAIFIISILLSIKNSLQLNKLEYYDTEQYLWVSQMSRALFVSTMAYLVSGAFLSRAYFDLYWAIFASSICLKFMVTKGEFYYDPDDKMLNFFRLPAVRY